MCPRIPLSRYDLWKFVKRQVAQARATSLRRLPNAAFIRQIPAYCCKSLPWLRHKLGTNNSANALSFGTSKGYVENSSRLRSRRLLVRTQSGVLKHKALQRNDFRHKAFVVRSLGPLHFGLQVDTYLCKSWKIVTLSAST